MTKLLDPVCGMTVDDTALRVAGHDDVAFCAPGCRTTFTKDPSAYPDRLESGGEEKAGCSCGEDSGAVCGCGGDHDSHSHTQHVEVHAKPAATGSGCCGGHGH